MPEWMKSDYQWVWNGELMRFAMFTAVGLGIALATQLSTGYDALEDGWWVPPTVAATTQLLDYVRGRLPARSPQPAQRMGSNDQ